MARKRQPKNTKTINTLPLYVLLIALFALYLVFQRITLLADVFGVALFLTIVATIIIEVKNGIQEQGFSRNVIEIVVVIVAVFIIWIALRVILNTQYPLDVVPSCSMLPVLHRGDLLVLRGINGPKSLKAPVINVTQSQYNAMINNINNEFMYCVAYQQIGNTAVVSQYVQPGYQIGLYSSAHGGSIMSYSSQDGNLVQYSCGVKTVKFINGSTAQEAYTTSLSIANHTLSGDQNNSIVVYATVPKDLFYQEGDSYIVHRVYAVLNESGNYYFLTKGDNNPGLDLQYGNYPANSTAVKGTIIIAIPYLGYLKLILTNQFNQPAGCSSTVQQ